MLRQKNWIYSSTIYQVFTGRWQSANLTDHQGHVFSRLAQSNFSLLNDLGINCIYLLGVFDNRGPIVVQNEMGIDLDKSKRLPSPFAITDHKTPNPLLGSLTELKQLISTFNSRGQKIILDFVPNHTGTTHPWVTTHPEYYQNSNQGFTTEFNQDVYKLNYQNPDLVDEMIAILLTIAGWGVDGVRCDMAHLIPLSFWVKAISTVRSKYKKFVFIGEIYPQSPFDLSLYQQFSEIGFDALYHGIFHQNLMTVLSNPSKTSDLISHLAFVKTQPYAYKLVNYLSNHDDPAINNLDLNQLLPLIFLVPGIPFIYNGSLNGFFSRLSHHSFQTLPDHLIETNHLDPQIQTLLQKLQSARQIPRNIHTNQRLFITNSKFDYQFPPN